MPTVAEFRASLKNVESDAVVDQWLLAPGAEHVSSANIDYIQEKVAGQYGSAVNDVAVWITGSAKLGFSISEKKRRDLPTLPRYRMFSAYSDIDVAVVSPSIFNLIWLELTDYSHRQNIFPWRSERLGDYLICGWLRPDHFPKGVRLYRCDGWWDTFKELSANTRFHRRAVRGGLFASIEQLRRYMSRAVDDCMRIERAL